MEQNREINSDSSDFQIGSDSVSGRDSAIVRTELSRRGLSQYSPVADTASDGFHPFVAFAFRGRPERALLILSVVKEIEFAILVGAHSVNVRGEVEHPAHDGLLLFGGALFARFGQNECIAFELHKVAIVASQHRLFGDPALFGRNVVVLR